VSGKPKFFCLYKRRLVLLPSCFKPLLILLCLFSLEDLNQLKILQWSLVIIYMDKCCNNFVFVCKKFYVSFVFSELNSPVGTYVISNLVQSDILKFHFSFNKAHNYKGVKCGLCFPSICVVWKLHKNPINLDLFVQPALLL